MLRCKKDAIDQNDMIGLTILSTEVGRPVLAYDLTESTYSSNFL